MRAREFIIENTSSLQPDVAAAIPAAYVIPKLKNQDPYLQYRFGLAIVAAKKHKYGVKDEFEPESAWGENQVIVSYANNIDEYIDDALARMGLSAGDKKLISTRRSEETKTVNIVSPIANWNKKK